MTKFLFKNINIIGLGLLGGSLAKACKKYGVGEKIYGFDADKSQTDFALENKIIDGIYNFSSSSSEDLIIICAPLSRYEEIFKKIGATLEDQKKYLDENLQTMSEKPIIIDVGSLKDFTTQLSTFLLIKNKINFIPCHPIAGSEKSGVVNSDADLFNGKKVIITPYENIKYDENHIKKVKLFWEIIGSKTDQVPMKELVESINSKEHDKIFALVSHLPQFLSFIAKEDFKNGENEILNRHFRLQNSNPRIWQEIFKLNEKNLRYYLDFFVKNLDNFQNENHRLVLVESFLKIPDIKKFEKYAGSGFKDFTAISGKNLPKENSIEFINQIKSKIKNYEFS